MDAEVLQAQTYAGSVRELSRVVLETDVAETALAVDACSTCLCVQVDHRDRNRTHGIQREALGLGVKPRCGRRRGRRGLTKVDVVGFHAEVGVEAIAGD